MCRVLKEHKKTILAAAVFVLLALLMWLRQAADSQNDILVREEPGGSVRQEQITYQTGDGVTQELELEVHPQECSEKEHSCGRICEEGSSTLGTGISGRE